MVFQHKGADYPIEVVRKNNKNTYIRIRNGCVYITTNYFMSKKQIDKLICKHYDVIGRMLDKEISRSKREDGFSLFGKKYDVVYDKLVEIDIQEEKIVVKNEQYFEKWLSDYIRDVFYLRLCYFYDLFEEEIPSPNLKIRKMKTRWGVCNTKNHNVTLNFYLYRYDMMCLDYVIVHELSHFIEPNHSKQFWAVVMKYYPNYKEARKMLKE